MGLPNMDYNFNFSSVCFWVVLLTKLLFFQYVHLFLLGCLRLLFLAFHASSKICLEKLVSFLHLYAPKWLSWGTQLLSFYMSMEISSNFSLFSLFSRKKCFCITFLQLKFFQHFLMNSREVSLLIHLSRVN